MSTMIINRKSVRYYRERCRDGKGQAWVCARDFLVAAGAPAPRALVGPFLADHLGAEAVQTLQVKPSDGSIHRLIYVHAEACRRLLLMYLPTPLATTANLALKGLAMTLNIKFEDGPVKVADVEVAAAIRRAAEAMGVKYEEPAEATVEEVAEKGEPKGEPEVQTYSLEVARQI